jgi:hypothetical protein
MSFAHGLPSVAIVPARSFTVEFFRPSVNFRQLAGYGVACALFFSQPQTAKLGGKFAGLFFG